MAGLQGAGILGLAATALLVGVFPQLGLVLCVVAGSLVKGLLQPHLGFVDLTVFLYAVTGGSILMRLIIRRERVVLPPRSFNLLVLVFAMFLVMGYFRSPLPEYGIQILMRFIVLDLGILYLVVAWGRTEARAKRLMATFAWVGLLYGTFLFINIVLVKDGLGVSQRFSAVLEGTSPVAVADILVTSLLFGLTLFTLRLVRWMRWPLLALVALTTAELVATDARGPLLSFGIASIIWGLVLLRRVNWKRLILPTSTVLIAGLSSFFLLPEQFVLRFAPSIALNPEATSAAVRLEGWELVGQHWKSWITAGAGLFGFAYAQTDGTGDLSLSGNYPHNLFLDVFSSVGLFGTIAFALLIAMPLRYGVNTMRKGSSTAASVAIGTIAAYIAFLVASCFSMGLIGTRQLFFLGGLLVVLNRTRGLDTFQRE